MAERMQKITPFQSSQGPTNEHEKEGTVKVRSRMAKAYMSGVDDPLHAALGKRTSYIPSGMHEFRHSTQSAPRGAHYNPAGEFGKRRFKPEPRSTYSYGSAPNRRGDNPLGSPRRVSSGNPLGSPTNRRGTNTAGSPPNRRGENALGNHGDRYGSNALASDFRPRGGGRHV